MLHKKISVHTSAIIFITSSRTWISKFLGIMWLTILTHYGKRSRKLQYFDIFHFSPSYSLDNVCYKIYFETCVQQLSCASQNGLLFLADFKFRRYLFSVAPTSNTQNSLLSLLSIFTKKPPFMEPSSNNNIQNRN